MAAPKTYKYTTEITQMCQAFDRRGEPDETVVQYMEDVVKSQLVEIVRSLLVPLFTSPHSLSSYLATTDPPGASPGFETTP